MLKAEIQPGAEYAMREKRVRGARFQHVRVIEHIRRNKWRVEWIDPHPGLIDYVESRQLIVPWKERRAFLKEEDNAERLRQHNERHGYDGENSPISNALHQVFESAGDGICFYRGSVTASPEALARFRARAGADSYPDSPATYVDRQGMVHLPFDEGLLLARKFCAAEPSAVLVGIEATERDWTHRASHGEDYVIGLLNDYRASWALIRQWAGHDAAIAQRESEIQRLERLVWDAVYMLQKAGLDHESARLRRAIQKG